MKRQYTVEQFKDIVHSFREEVPEITLSTDIICGFPREGSDDFERTLNLVKEVKPDIVNISKFFVRPKTPAKNMEQLDSRDVKDRSRRLTRLVNTVSFIRNQRWLNWTGNVLVDEKGKGNSWASEHIFGQLVRVKVINAFKTYLEGELVEPHPASSLRNFGSGQRYREL